jgi:pyruvate oxidase
VVTGDGGFGQYLAEFTTSCGGLGITVRSADELDDAISRAPAYDGPALVDILADPALT